MSAVKQLIYPQRQRKIPDRFSWIDHRLVEHRHILKCGPWAWTLYLFLVTVGDAQGISFYGDATILRLLAMDLNKLQKARDDLIQADMIAYQKPIYQVLDLSSVTSHTTPSLSQIGASTPQAPIRNAGQPEAVRAVIRNILEKLS